MKGKPRILIFTGDGKGKTTAALGMVLRAVGHKLPTLIVQFIKSDTSTGEYAVLETLSGVTIRQVGRGFVPAAGTAAWEEHREAAARGLEAAARDLDSGKYRMVILDEICAAVARGLVAEATVMDAVERAGGDDVVVMTGRGASRALIEMADTVTEMCCVKHGYRNGFPACKGVER